MTTSKELTMRMNCGKEFKKRSDVHRHLALVHNVAKNPFYIKYLKENRVVQKSLDPVQKCPNCDKTFTRKADLHRHAAAVHNVAENAFYVKYLKIPSDLNSIFQGAVKSEFTQISEQPELVMRTVPKCDKCDKTFTRMTGLKVHMREVHEKVRVECPFCPETFTKNSSMYKHISIEHDRIKSECKYCGEEFAHSKNLEKHVAENHGENVAILPDDDEVRDEDFEEHALFFNQEMQLGQDSNF